MARFGDGELAIAFRIPRQKFQRVDEKLAERIWEVLNTDTPENLLLAVADHYGSLDRFNEQAAEGIRLYMTEETRRQHEQIIPANRVYSDTYVTRPYVIYRDVFTEAPRQRFEMLKTIWKGKRIIVVEGAQTRLGVGNDLLSGAGEIRRILAPATNSFDRYEGKSIRNVWSRAIPLTCFCWQSARRPVFWPMISHCVLIRRWMWGILIWSTNGFWQGEEKGCPYLINTITRLREATEWRNCMIRSMRAKSSVRLLEMRILGCYRGSRHDNNHGYIQ